MLKNGSFVNYIFNKYKKNLLFSFLISLCILGNAQNDSLKTTKPFIRKAQKVWVDSVFNSLSDEQKLGQLFMVAAYSNRNEKHTSEIEKLIKENNLGGVIFFQGGPVRQANLTNKYQAQSKVPMFVAMDAEWGLSMRLDSTVKYPKQMTLGAIQDNKYIYQMGKEIARQCRRLGVHINFAPVVDINSNPNNPVIGMRSFGEDKHNVTQKGIAYMKGMQDFGVMANAKHFPGHGDTESDSHLSLPVVNHNKKRLEEIELYPFKQLIKDSVQSIMVAHLHVPAIDKTHNLATTLSPAAVTELLKEDLGFKGLIFTDALNMKGVSSYYKPGEVDLKALMAGNDVLLYSEDVPLSIEKILKAINKGDLDKEDIFNRVKKILNAKYQLGLDTIKPIETEHLYQDLNNSKALSIQQDCFEQAITVVKNDNNLIPFKHIENTNFVTINIGLTENNNYTQTFESYTNNVTHLFIEKDADKSKFNALKNKINSDDIVIIGIHSTNPYNNRHYGITESTKEFISEINKTHKVVLCVFGNPYSLKFFEEHNHLICAYEDLDVTRGLLAQVLFGGTHTTAKLPITASNSYKIGTGLLTNNKVKRLGFAYPESLKMDSRTLLYIDSVCLKTIEEKAAPGCQVFVAKNGKIVFEKSYGRQAYEENSPDVNDQTIYDIASITKVAGTLQAFMFLQERGLVDLDKKISFYLTDLIGTNKENLVIRDILTHQASLQPFLPFWKRTTINGQFNPQYYRTIPSDSFPNLVVQDLYSLSSIEDTLWKWVSSSALQTKTIYTGYGRKRRKRKVLETGYVYSDLGFYITKRLCEKILNQPIEEFLEEHFYQSMGLKNLMYNPLGKIDSYRIAPTEQDVYFRKKLVRGTVHDQGAAMLGGVGGHAGLFSNAHDLGVLMQMNLQDGQYGGIKYFQPGTIKSFASKQFTHNRRGLGWDKPEVNYHYGPTSYLASGNTFGHTGFTGTCAWVDPDSQLVFVFLSNRIYPDAMNKKLIELGTRTAIQEVIYKSILNYKD